MFAPLSVEEFTESPKATDTSMKMPIVPVPNDARPCHFRHPEYGDPAGM